MRQRTQLELSLLSLCMLQVGVVVTIDSPSVFQLIFRYINRNLETVPAEVVVTPEDPLEEVQMAKVNFPSTGRYVTKEL